MTALSQQGELRKIEKLRAVTCHDYNSLLLASFSPPTTDSRDNAATIQILDLSWQYCLRN